MQIHVASRDLIDNAIRYRLFVKAIFKNPNKLRRIKSNGQIYFWIPNANAICKCPNMKVGRKYIMIGNIL